MDDLQFYFPILGSFALVIISALVGFLVVAAIRARRKKQAKLMEVPKDLPPAPKA